MSQYGADAMRFALALSGDSNEDANFEHSIANAAILKLTSEVSYAEVGFSYILDPKPLNPSALNYAYHAEVGFL